MSPAATEIRFRRTLVGLKFLVLDVRRVRNLSFRRTLVGLKFPVGDVVVDDDVEFQTYPRGVEVSTSSSASSSVPRFRRTLVGLKSQSLSDRLRLSCCVSDVPSWG